MKNLILLFVALIVTSCNKSGPTEDINSIEANLRGEGAFIINEGNFMSGNGSLSFYSYSTGNIYNDLFSLANNRPLGDVPYSMEISGNKGYIIVNNSGKIEVIDKNTMVASATINGLTSPRKILLITSSKAYVSSLYSNSLSIIDLNSNLAAGSINIRRSSEAMVLLGNKAYISSWYQGKDIMVVNTTTDKIIDSIEVAPEPESMILDKNNKLWVLCSGGYTGSALAELIVVNTVSDEVEKHFVFPAKLSYPVDLQINKTKDTIYYVDNGLWRMSIQSAALPDKPFKQPSNRFIYKLGIDPRNGRIFYTDAMDYQQKGFVLQLNSMGVLIDSCKADIIPGSLCFK